jgi:hypothetical protein
LVSCCAGVPRYAIGTPAVGKLAWEWVRQIQRHKCELVHIDLQQNGLVIDMQRSSIMWTRYELVSFGFVAVVIVTGVGMFSTLLH